MTFKKNWLSIVIWIPFALVICAVYGLAFYRALPQIPVAANNYIQIGITVLSFGLVAGIFVGIRKLSGIMAMQKHLLWEALIFTVFLGAGVFLRCCFLYHTGEGTEYFKEAAYFEAAKVTGSAVAPIAHGAQYFYVVLLRGLFWLFGNHFFAGLVLQIVLQSAATVIWYLAIRKMTGAAAALTFLTGVMFLPQSIESGLRYSPKYLYLLLAGIVFCSIIGVLKREYILKPLKWYSYVMTLLAGAGIGLLTCLDITGLIFLIPVLALGCVSVKEGTEKIALKKKLMRVGLQTTAIIAGFCLAACLFLYVDALQSASSMGKVFAAWCTLFQYKGIGTIPAVFLYEGAQWIHVGILFLLVLSIPAFFVRKKQEIQLLWMLLLAAAGIIHAGGFYAQGMNCDSLLLFLVLALTGAGIQALTAKEVQPVNEELSEEAGSSKEPEPSEEAESSKEPEPSEETELSKEPEPSEETETEAKEVITESEPEGEIKPRFIENPLPLPKKHVKKTMGYGIEVTQEHMKYDIEVSDTDDFDI